MHRRLDIQPDMRIWASGSGKSKDSQFVPSFPARSRPERIQRLVDRRMSAIEPQIAAARELGQAQILDTNAWSLDEIAGPNITDKETVLSLAKMTLDAYTLEPFSGEWKDVKGGFNYSQSFGWEGDGLRGHIFADTDNSTIVIAIKGTSAGKFGMMYF
jgi:lipase ATG15